MAPLTESKARVPCGTPRVARVPPRRRASSQTGIGEAHPAEASPGGAARRPGTEKPFPQSGPCLTLQRRGRFDLEVQLLLLVAAGRPRASHTMKLPCSGPTHQQLCGAVGTVSPLLSTLLFSPGTLTGPFGHGFHGWPPTASWEARWWAPSTCSPARARRAFQPWAKMKPSIDPTQQCNQSTRRFVVC